MKKLLQNGRKQTVRNLNSLLREMKENTRFISENKNTQFANKNLLRLLKEYKKTTDKFVGYSFLLEFIDNDSKLTIDTLGKIIPILFMKNHDNEIGNYLKELQFGRAAAAISASDDQMRIAATAGRGSDFRPMRMDRPRTNYLRSGTAGLFEQLKGDENPEQLIDIVSETIGKTTGFIRGYLNLFGDEENLQKLRDLASGRKKQGFFSRLVSKGSDSELISMIKKAFKDSPEFVAHIFANELKKDPSIIDANVKIVGEVESIAHEIPEIDQELRGKINIPLGSRIASLLSSPGDGGGVFGRAPKEE